MNVNEIKHNIIDNGLGRKNRFQVLIPQLNNLNLFAKAANMVETQVGTSPYRYTAPTSQHPNDIIHGDLTISFYVDKDYAVRKVFQQWLDEMVNLETGLWGYRNDYARDIIVEALDVDGSVKLTTEYISCIPKTISELSMDFESQDEIQTLDVSFVFQYYNLK